MENLVKLPIWKKVVGVIGFIGAVSGIFPVYDRAKTHVVGKIDEYIHEQVVIKLKEERANKTGGFRHETSEELERKGYNVLPEELPHIIAEMYVWTDSLKEFDRALKPILKFEQQYEPIGLYRNRTDGFYWYRSPDSELYRAYPIRDTTQANGYFEYVDKHGVGRVVWVPSH